MAESSDHASSRSDHETAVLLTRFALPTALLVSIAAFECLFRLPSLYLGPGPEEGTDAYFSALLISFAGAAVWGWRRRLPHTLLPGWLTLSAAFAGFSGVFWYLWLGEARAFWLLLGYAVLAGVGAGSGLIVWLSVFRLALQAALVERAFTPWRLLLLAVVGVGLLSLLTDLGTLRSGAALALLLAAASLAALGTLRHIEQAPIAFGWNSGRVNWLVLAAGLVSLAAFEAWVPSAALTAYDNSVLLYRASPRGDVAITAGKKQFQIFTHGLLRVSSLDEQRYFESLVQPALSLAKERKRVLLIGAGDGYAAREVLRHTEVKELWLIAESPALVELSQNMTWLLQGSHAALRDPRVRMIEEEAILWLSRAHAPFDVILLDAPDPRDPVAGKYSTRFFLQSVRKHLKRDGVLALQASASKTDERVVRNLVATAEAADFSALAYSAPVPTLGLWNFVLASPTPSVLRNNPRELPAGLRYLDRKTLAALLASAHTQAPELPAGEVSLLYRQTTVEAFLGSAEEP